MAIQRETELYDPVKRFFEERGYQVKGEVNGCDLVAIREDDGEPVIVELKKGLTVALLIQGVDRSAMSDRVYLCIEKPAKKRGPAGQKWSDCIRLCRRLGLGLMAVTFYRRKPPLVELFCDPEPPSARRSRKGRQSLVQEFRERSGDYNVGGSTGRKLMTAYREKALHIAFVLQRSGEASPREVKRLTSVAETAAILQRNVYGWFRRARRGAYVLTEAGTAALGTYADVLKDRLARFPLPEESATSGSPAAPAKKRSRKAPPSKPESL